VTARAGQSLDRSMARAVAWNAAAKFASQALSWASTIVVARLLTPYDYGLIGLGGLYLALATLVGQVGISDAVIALRDLTRRQIAELNAVAVLVGLGLVGLSSVVAVPLARFFAAPPLRGIVIAASVTYIITAFQVVPRALLQRELRFKLLASVETARVFCQVAVTVVLAWLGFRYWSLVLGHIASCAVATGLTCYFRRHEFAVPKVAELRRELRFSGHVLLSGISWYSYDNSDFFVAGRVLGEVPLGNYSVAWTIASAPVEKIANLVTGVTPAFFSSVQSDKAELRRYLLRLTELLSLVTVPASIGLALASDYLVPVLLGPKWLGVIGPLRLLGIFVAARSLGTILPNLLTAIGDARFVMWATIGSAIVMPLAFFAGSHWGPNGIAAAWVIIYPLIIAPMYYRVFQKTGVQAAEYASAILPAVSASVIMTVVVIFVRVILPNGTRPLFCLLLVIATGALSYAGALLAFHRRRVTQLVRTIRGMRGQNKAVT
jgi:O-antigen/teichoic acid export membrane protein